MIGRSTPALRSALAALVLSALAIVGTATAAGATLNCGQHSFGFVGTRLLNDGISTTAGPYSIELPAGTYDVMMSSYDAHDEHPGQTDQPYEQWYFTLDSGYTSPLSTDVPDDATITIDSFNAVVIGASTSITVHHRELGSVNSVEPLCVGFTPVADGVPADPQASVDISTTPDVATSGSNTPASSDDAADLVRPIDDDPAVEVKPATEVRATELVPAAGISATQITGTAPQLALTGPSSQIWLAALTGATLVLLGVALVIQGRREIV